MLWGAFGECLDCQWMSVYIGKVSIFGSWPKYKGNSIRFPIRISMLGLLEDVSPYVSVTA